MNLPRISPGRLTALWVVLRSLETLGDGISGRELQAFGRRSGLRSGGLPISDGYDLAVAGGFVAGDEALRLTSLGREALSRCEEEEPTHEVLRLFTSVLVLRHPPAWVAYWQGDPASLDFVLPEGAREILRDADLLTSVGSTEDLEAWAWWDALKGVPPLEETAGNRKAVGDAAEALSLVFEQHRLRREGFPTLADRVRWVARESPAYGFDILSYCGTSHPSGGPELPLAIEVKGMAVARRAVFNFYLTEHEWRTAINLGERYVFHFWDGVQPGDDPRARSDEPLIVRASSLGQHLPTTAPCGQRCRWQSAFVAFPAGES